jgi:hypothetical protein
MRQGKVILGAKEMMKTDTLCITDLHGFMKSAEYSRGLCAQVRDESRGKLRQANKPADVKTPSRGAAKCIRLPSRAAASAVAREMI